MLAEQGHLAELVEHNLVAARRPSSTPNRTKNNIATAATGTRSMAKTTTPTAGRRRPRPKRRR